MGLHVKLPDRSVLFDEGQPVSSVFVVCEGRLKLSSTSREGRTMILRIAGPGDVLGLSAILSGQHHEVTAEAIEPVGLKSIRAADFLAFFEEFSEVSKRAAKVAAREYQDAYVDARRLALSGSAQAKLAHLLLNWFHACPETDAAKINMTLTHEELANLCGVARETVTRTLNQFERDGLIQRRGVSLRLSNAEGLERISG
jgi:CRP/FNR family transcriptional regulator, cyclic AMP receptor protein